MRASISRQEDNVFIMNHKPESPYKYIKDGLPPRKYPDWGICIKGNLLFEHIFNLIVWENLSNMEGFCKNNPRQFGPAAYATPMDEQSCEFYEFLEQYLRSDQPQELPADRISVLFMEMMFQLIKALQHPEVIALIRNHNFACVKFYIERGSDFNQDFDVWRINGHAIPYISTMYLIRVAVYPEVTQGISVDSAMNTPFKALFEDAIRFYRKFANNYEEYLNPDKHIVFNFLQLLVCIYYPELSIVNTSLGRSVSCLHVAFPPAERLDMTPHQFVDYITSLNSENYYNLIKEYTRYLLDNVAPSRFAEPDLEILFEYMSKHSVIAKALIPSGSIPRPRVDLVIER